MTRKLIEGITRSIVTDEDSLQIDVHEGAFQTTFTVRASGSDVGKLVGKRGSTIQAIRDLFDLIGERTGEYYTIWVEETADTACLAAK